MELAERFWSKVNQDGPVPAYDPSLGPCWLWLTGTNGDSGYGRFWYQGHVTAHRFAYQWLVGVEVPVGMQLDHLCRNRPCVNPGHLEIVTAYENMLRGFSPFANNARKNLCVRGHVLGNEINGYGSRRCKLCQVAWDVENYARRGETYRCPHCRKRMWEKTRLANHLRECGKT